VLNLLTQSIVIWRYLGMLMLPTGQSIMHAVHAVTSITDPIALGALGGLVGLFILALSVRRALPLVAFGILWFLVVIAPSSSIVALREGMAEHRAYLASAGAFMVIAAVAAVVLSRTQGKRTDVPTAFAATLCLAILVLGSLTVKRNGVWQDPVALWRQAVEASSGMWEPHYALGDSLRQAGDCAAAIGEYESVLAARPDNRDARLNLGICLGQAGRLDEADAEFHEVLRADPQFPRVYTNLAALALVRGLPESARDYYRRAIDVDPKNVTARLQLARLYEQTFHDYRAAAVLCDEARVIAPATPGATDCVERNRTLVESAGR
jgi:Tfp pilus assembly protein PilF